jgi:hypothetical protein
LIVCGFSWSGKGLLLAISRSSRFGFGGLLIELLLWIFFVYNRLSGV